MNRAQSRAMAKAVRTITRGTKVPGGVRAKLGEKIVAFIAHQQGKKIGRHGAVLAA